MKVSAIDVTVQLDIQASIANQVCNCQTYFGIIISSMLKKMQATNNVLTVGIDRHG